MTATTQAGSVRAPNNRRSIEDGFSFSTEARPGLVTTEFLLTMLASVIVVIAAYVSESVSQELGWTLFTAIVVGYIVSRGIAKAGSREGPFQFDGRDGNAQ